LGWKPQVGTSLSWKNCSQTQSMALQIGYLKMLERKIRAAGREPLEPSSNDQGAPGANVPL